jgi:hypothetical protein
MARKKLLNPFEKILGHPFLRKTESWDTHSCGQKLQSFRACGDTAKNLFTNHTGKIVPGHRKISLGVVRVSLCKNYFQKSRNINICSPVDAGSAQG